MHAKLLNAISMVLLVAAVALAALAISASSRSVRIQGPSALAVLPDGTVWLAVDASLWHLDADGRRIARVDPGIGRIGDLVLHPDGRLVAHARPSATLHFLDPASGRVLGALEPHWPADLADEGGDAINYSFQVDGRVAIAAGGDDTVALFDAHGKLLARTAPGTYKFTNGLWWNGDDLWTTDTNRPALVELDGRTLGVKSRIALTGQSGSWRYLGMAVASHGMASGAAHQAPLATLIRFANGMTRGHATDVFADGSQADYPASPALEPRDIKWRGSELLLVDNASFAIKRYSAAREALADFGDDGVRGELAAMHAQRDALRHRYRLFLGLAGVLAVTAIVLYALGGQRARGRIEPEARGAAGESEREGALRHALYSLVAPGLGQWLQGRGGMALVFFLAWMVALSLDAAVAFTRVKHLSAVPAGLMLYGAAGYLLVCLLAALNAWNRGQPGVRDPRA